MKAKFDRWLFILGCSCFIALMLVQVAATSAGLSIAGATAIRTMTIPDADFTAARTDAANTFTGVQTFNTPIAASSLATATATVGGAVPTPPNNTTTFLRGDMTFATPTSSGGNAIYGDGIDGTLDFSVGGATQAGATRSSTTYTMQRDICCANATIEDTITVVTNGYRFFCNGTVTFVGSGNFSADGTAGGATGSGGTSPTTTILPNGGAGAAGGTAGGSSTSGKTDSVGARGGSGGSGSGGSGGTAGTVTAPTGNKGGSNLIRIIPYCLEANETLFSAGSQNLVQAVMGTGGGGGGGDGASGAGGGAAGNYMVIVSKNFSASGTSGTQMHANGGAGGNASSGTNTGGGGGGGGGVVVIITSAALPAGVAATANGGALGTKKAGGTGNDGVAGSNGTVVTIIN